MKITFVTILIFILSSCSSEAEGNHLVVVLEKGNNIRVGNSVIIDEHKVGTIEKIDLNSTYEVCVTISLDENLQLPVDSKFRVTQINLYEIAIQIEPGVSRHMLTTHDSVQGTRS